MKRFEVWLVRLDPAAGSEMQKTRPCVIVSPDALNARIRTAIVAPLTRGGFAAPFRVPCRFKDQEGQIALDHLRAGDKTRLLGVRHAGSRYASGLVGAVGGDVCGVSRVQARSCIWIGSRAAG